MADYEQFASGEGRRVLIVDDDEAVLKGLADYFTRLGYDVVRASTGKQGLDGFKAQEPDVTILDLRLPDIDGMQVLQALREQRKALVIMLTGYGDIPTAVRAMQLGAENFLTKPVDLPHLVVTVERAIEKLDLRRENVRLRSMVPTTRKRVIQAVSVVVLLVAALFVGRWVGNMGSAAPSLPSIAPIHTSGGGGDSTSAPRDSQRQPAPAPPAQAAPRR